MTGGGTNKEMTGIAQLITWAVLRVGPAELVECLDPDHVACRPPHHHHFRPGASGHSTMAWETSNSDPAYQLIAALDHARHGRFGGSAGELRHRNLQAGPCLALLGFPGRLHACRAAPPKGVDAAAMGGQQD